MIWSRLFGGEKNDSGWDIDILSNGNIVIAGEESNKPLLLEISPNGDLVYKYDTQALAESRFLSVEAIEPGRFALAGESTDKNGELNGFISPYAVESAASPNNAPTGTPTSPVTSKLGRPSASMQQP